MSLTAYVKTYEISVNSKAYNRTKDTYFRSIIIEEQPSTKLMRWGRKNNPDYYTDFELQMPYTLYAFYASSSLDWHIEFCKEMSIYFSPRPYAQARPEEIYAPPLGNVFARGEVCFDLVDDFESATMIDLMNIFWEKNFNRDLYTHTFAVDMFSAMRKHAGARNYNHVLKVYNYWQNNLNTPDKICDFISEMPYMDIPKLSIPKNKINSINNSSYFSSNNNQYFFDDEKFVSSYLSSHSSRDDITVQVSLNDYQVFDVLEEEELSKEIGIL